MAHHSEQNLLEDNDVIDFEVNSNSSSVKKCGEDFQVFDNMWNNVGTFQDNVFWQPIQSMGYLPADSKMEATLSTAQFSSVTSQHLTTQECLMRSTSLPHRSSTPLFPNSDCYPTNMTPIMQGSAEPTRKTILQQLIDGEFQSPQETPKFKPKPRRKYNRRQVSKKFTPNKSSFLFPPSTKIYEENWLNEVYWFHFNDFMKVNFFDKIMRVTPPQEASLATNQGSMADHPSPSTQMDHQMS